MDNSGANHTLIELATSRRRPDKVEVRAGGRVIGTLSPASVMTLGLRAGETLPPGMAERIEHRMNLERAYKAAADALARRPMTVTALRERLERRGFEASVVDETVAALSKEGLINDVEVARELVRHAVSRGGAGAVLLESKLAAKGVDSETAKRVLDEELLLSGGSAEDAARRRAHSIPHGLSLEAKARRLYAYLARRGFDEHESTEAVSRVLGTAPGTGAEE